MENIAKYKVRKKLYQIQLAELVIIFVQNMYTYILYNDVYKFTYNVYIIYNIYNIYTYIYTSYNIYNDIFSTYTIIINYNYI